MIWRYEKIYLETPSILIRKLASNDNKQSALQSYCVASFIQTVILTVIMQLLSEKVVSQLWLWHILPALENRQRNATSSLLPLPGCSQWPHQWLWRNRQTWNSLPPEDWPAQVQWPPWKPEWELRLMYLKEFWLWYSSYLVVQLYGVRLISRPQSWVNELYHTEISSITK